MNSFLAYSKEAFIQIVKVTFPLILLAGILSLFDTGVLLGAFLAIVFTIIEIRIVIKSTIPWISDLFAFLLSDSAVPAEEDSIMKAVSELKTKRDIQGLTAALRLYTEKNPKLLQAWLLRASFLCDDPLCKYDEAVESLKEALAAARWRKEDKAMLLFKIGKIYEIHLNNAERAAAYYTEAAHQYPMTAYGKKAAEKIGRDG